jgi:hypothetical protein
MPDPAYPVQLTIDYPDRPLNRVSTGLRIFAAIPILVVLVTVSGGNAGWGDQDWGNQQIAVGTGGLLVLAPLLMLVFRHKYPRWWFEFNRELMRFSFRVSAYLALMDDRYPSTDEPQGVHLDFEYPEVERDLNRWLPLVKWLLAIPHYIILFFLDIAAIVVIIITWFQILFTGNYQRGLFDFVVGVMRWNARVTAYAFILVTDVYPPFRLDA